MKKTQLTFLQRTLGTCFLIVLMMMLNPLSSFSQTQCALGCNSNVQVSLDNATCTAVITAEMLLGTTPPSTCPNGVFQVIVTHNGNTIPNATVTKDHVGKTLQAKVLDTNSGNSCWGYLHIEDKLPPVIVCEDPDDIYCYELDTYEPEVTENCDDYTLSISGESIITNNCTSGHPDNVLKIVTRTYIATDKSGNKSAPCTIQFNVLAVADLDDIDAPINYLFPVNNLQCDGIYKKDAKGNPHPDVTGVPTLDGTPLWPNPYITCNLLVDYNDIKLPAIGCVTKIMRTWTIIEWKCNPRTITPIVQMIEIADSKGPVITGEKDLTISTSQHDCSAHFYVPGVTVTDNCSASNQITVTISGGDEIINGNGGYTHLDVGEYKLYYRATDACGNVTTDSINVWVSDNTPPVAVCDQNTVVSLTSDGEAWVHATSFDNGSYDECQLSKMLVRRMDQGCLPCTEPQFPGFHHLGSHGGHHYYISQHAANPSLAFKNAKAMGGYAVSLETLAEVQWLAEALEAKNFYDCYTVGLKFDLNDFSLDWESGVPFDPTAYNLPASLIDSSNIYFCLGLFNSAAYFDNVNTQKYIIEITDPCGLSAYTKFCCADIPASKMVQFRVIDVNGNYNDCMVNVTVQDKLPPSIICPNDRTVDCDTYYEVNNLSATFGSATSVDNCQNLPIVELDSFFINQCNIGYIKRLFTVTDAGGRKATCDQIITLRPDEPFYINVNNPLDPNDDIIWPVDVTLNDGCDDPNAADYSPEKTGKPVFLDGTCQLVGADYDDKIFRFNNSNGEACFKILRTWEVIDWCQFINGRYYTVTYTQVIKVNNTVDPIIRSSCARKTVCTYDALCEDGYIELTASATDDCTTGLRWWAQIDLDNDGSFDTGLTITGTGTSATTQNPTIANASGVYPIGSHRVLWTFEDKCGNQTSCNQLFDVVNCKAPTPYLLNGLAVDLMPVTNNTGQIIGGMVEIWAKDFDNGSSHPCGYEVLLSFSPDVTDRSYTFTCDDVGENTVTIYASIITPQGDTIRAWANTFIDIQDNMGVCDDNKIANISGKVMTEKNEGVENATIILQSNEQTLKTSNEEGVYDFGYMEQGGNYTITGSKTDDYLNGVNTLDLVMMQRHILDIEKIKTPYQLVAADVNKDKKITASDLVELRKLILGVDVKLKNNESWRFVDKGFTFPDPANAQAANLKESYEIYDLSSDMSVDFVGVKVGDVNNSVVAHLNDNQSENRNSKQVNLVVEAKQFKAGDLVTVNVSTENETELYGMQFTLNFNKQIAEFNDITGVDATMDANNFGFTNMNEGKITASWASDNKVRLNNIMTVSFVAKQDGNTADLFELTSDVTKAEAYNSNMETVDVVLRSKESSVEFELYQNTPNPFNNYTVIGFKLPSESDVTLSIMDVTGKLISKVNGHYAAGEHTVSIDKSTLSQSGVLYYQLEAGEFTATKKMVVIE